MSTYYNTRNTKCKRVFRQKNLAYKKGSALWRKGELSNPMGNPHGHKADREIKGGVYVQIPHPFSHGQTKKQGEDRGKEKRHPPKPPKGKKQETILLFF
jgi:hypothetical protein